MKILVKILIVILIIIAIPLFLALFISHKYEVSREITIDRPQKEVFNYIRYLKNQDNYHHWVRLDPNMKKSYRGTDGTVGFVYAWDGNDEAGKGEEEITKIYEGERIDVEVRFEKPMEGKAFTPISTEPVGANQTKVTWKMTGRQSYPCNFMNLFMDNMLGKDLDKSLVSLKNILEKK
jgi:hypothetical protein